MPLAQVFPRDEILAVAPAATITACGLAEFDAFAGDQRETARGFGFACWDHALSSGQHEALDLQMLAGAVNAGDPLLLRRVEEALGQAALFDFHHVTARLGDDPEPFAALSLAHLYPNHLHIGDVLLLDPTQPRNDSHWADQRFRSLRLFPLVLDRLVAAAGDLGAEKLTLTAANRPLRATFERYGFTMADTMGAKMVEAAGVHHSFPMELKLS